MDVAYNNSDDVDILAAHDTVTFTTKVTYLSGSKPISLAVGDFNNDTRLDIVVTNANDSNASILLGYGNGSFLTQSIYLTGFNSQPHSVAVDDFNNDTFSDIIVANNDSSNVVILLGYGDGTFADPKVVWVSYGSRPFSVVGGDFNNDKKMDFVVASYGTGSLNIVLQTC